ncbi:DUF1707 domain-containing protein [Rhodococcus triatomae]|uniref:DUF1707 domain-containing protein n=1 Tax=Rhodococcus triatomae TaxID=300028 RepID=A0A1G8F2X4_9NOCA|nr:DUF1707 domain-containing protein [Rhodococcus triatomae]QNG19370.1 DUF1707 domain-containing protein [Rhodococcus triatomae]QNG24717.1 DUF1707 domain-containing protein [Rhodococcus triatomae]SDH76359.1 protein of unknown function [Rhodococcus triatomae]
MTEQPGPDDLFLSDDERLHALNVISEHYAAGRLDSGEFYDRSGEIASARTLPTVREAFRGLPGGLPLEVKDGHIRKIQLGETAPAVREKGKVARSGADDGAESELSSLRRRGNLVESIDWVIIGITLMTFLALQFVVGWDYAWVVWPSLILTLSIPRMILDFSDEDEEVYEELKESEAEARKKRLRLASERIRELEGRNDPDQG